MDVPVGERGQFVFGPFLLDPVRRRVTRHGVPVSLTPTRFDTLHYLVANAGRVIGKDELMAAIWPGRLVEEANLTQTISYLRRTLHDIEAGAESYIATAPGRGYRFAECVQRHDPAPQPAAITAPASLALGPPPPRARNGVVAPSRRSMAIAAICATPAVLLAWLLLREPPPRFDPPLHSVAIMAFTNEAGSAAPAYFADGMSEALIHTLARIDGVSVAGRRSAFSFRDRNVTVPEIARALNVRAVLEGAVRQDAEHLRIQARLIDGVTGYQIWARSYDRTLADMGAVQADIAFDVATLVAGTMPGAEAGRLTAGKTTSARAYDAYLRATGLIRFYSEASLRAAGAAYDEAIHSDPAYADAYAGHAIVQARLAVDWPNDTATIQTVLRQSLAEADRAILLAPQSAEAHAARATVLVMSLDFRDAEAEIRRARELGPGILEVQRQYAIIENAAGHSAEAVAAARHLAALDPLTSGVYLWLAGMQMYARTYADALASLQTESALGAADPRRSAMLKATVHLAAGRPDLAILDCQSVREGPNGSFDYLLAIAYKRLGRTEAAQHALQQWIARNRRDDYGTLLAYASWGDLAHATPILHALYDARDINLIDLKVNPLLDAVRATQEYRSIIGALNYPP